jgi:hypothetical protein
VSRCASNLMEVILSMYYKCTLWAITHKLNISRHMLIWTCFFSLGCRNRAQNLFVHFSYTCRENMWPIWSATLLYNRSHNSK